MPHVTIEYSANLEQRLDIAALCATALEAAASTGVLELGATRVRAVRCDHYAIADRHRDNAFVDVSLRIGRGRSEEARSEEHTSELQSLMRSSYAVFCLKTKKQQSTNEKNINY